MSLLPPEISLEFTEREIRKVIAFFEIVSPFTAQSKQLIDLCSGNGLNSFAFLYNEVVNHSSLYDLRRNSRFEKLQQLFKKYGLQFNYSEADITSKIFSLEGDFITAIHPCSELTDRVIELGLTNNIPFALMSCCHKTKGVKHNLENPPDPRLMLYDSPDDYFDLVRQRYIKEQGWQCYREEISEKITKKNHILIGIP